MPSESTKTHVVDPYSDQFMETFVLGLWTPLETMITESSGITHLGFDPLKPL